ncbi:hypothetical protein OPV22_019043 [Ensete ventricosum]|uniref:Uncharacterized protein n=1 Tax=Ensete ventricosum TaxID=4639 RepID=A0AAV8R5Y4_ENSVE|nr:hypothetical protein OPV22_019043 [Ensete ventricosum]
MNRSSQRLLATNNPTNNITKGRDLEREKAGKKRGEERETSGDGEVVWESLPRRSGRPPHGPGAIREHLDRVLGLLRPHLDQPLPTSSTGMTRL